MFFSLLEKRYTLCWLRIFFRLEMPDPRDRTYPKENPLRTLISKAIREEQCLSTQWGLNSPHREAPLASG